MLSQLDDFSSRGDLNRWHLIDGQPRCPLDPVPVNRISDADRAVILAANAAVRDKMNAVLAYEAAQLRLMGEEPPETILEADEDGDAVQVPNPAYQAWAAAEATVAGAGAETIALAARRAGVFQLDEAGNPIVPDPDPVPADSVTLLAPLPDSVTPRQFRAALRHLGLRDAAEAYEATLDEAAAEEWEYAVEIDRLHPFIEGARVALGLTSSQRDDVFRLAKTL